MRNQLTSGLPPDAMKEDLLLTQWAVKYGKLNILKLLLKSGANVNKRNSKGATPLYFAVQQNDSEAVKVLLDQDDIEVDLKAEKDGIGWTPLFRACAEGYLKIVSLLLSKGADVNSPENTGCSELFALKHGK